LRLKARPRMWTMSWENSAICNSLTKQPLRAVLVCGIVLLQAFMTARKYCPAWLTISPNRAGPFGGFSLMIKFDVITIFPNLFKNFISESLLARAQKKKLIKINLRNLRNWADDKHQTVDGRPYGGGAGMILKIEPIFRAVKSLKFKVKSKKSRVILLSAKGRTFTQKDAQRLAKYDQITFICGRYEGVDERVAKYIADEEISIGNYVLFGGEVPAMVMIEAISRLIPGVVAKEESIKNESFTKNITKEYPHYTRPEVFVLNGKKLKVPPVLLSGNHKNIEEWRAKNSK